jgi:hypothetical protein
MLVRQTCTLGEQADQRPGQRIDVGYARTSTWRPLNVNAS